RAEVVRGNRRELLAATPATLPSQAYLVRVVAQREWSAVRGVLLAVESLAGRDAAQLLTRAARAGDPQLRAQAIEAVDSLADRPLTRHLVPLLEDEPAAGSPHGDVTTWSVLTDPDQWLRALAVRAAIDQIRALQSLLTDRVRRDDSPLVAEVLRAAEEVPMAPSDPMSGLLDRILALQQVPMFSDLAPEDLQQVAERCAERTYRPHEVIYRQGDLGDEMFLITAGQVRISRTVAGRTEVLRSYGPGHHVGELALLRGLPRVADVIADDTGASGLALDATSFRSILDGRPEVAMAMLATLAERIGTA
ncbi:MAG TPA: cyclic nucleotide-binding domain-containing protein, partial [Euzebyales bacterium]|nr:cyclic nucleotide-binding domain-containing protein [Euzebyales bacterium]